MITNKKMIIWTITIILLIISIPTIYIINKNYNNNILHVTESKIIEQAKACYFDDVCLDEIITLKMLYENNYLEKVSNPVTKEYYNDESYVERNGNDFKFVVIE